MSAKDLERKRKSAKERKRVQKGAKERFRVKVDKQVQNNQVWELPGFGLLLWRKKHRQIRDRGGEFINRSESALFLRFTGR